MVSEFISGERAAPPARELLENTAELLLLAFFLLPAPAFTLLEIKGQLPGDLGDVVSPACVQFLWALPAIPLLLARPRSFTRPIRNAILLLLALATYSIIASSVSRTAAPHEAWMPPVAGALALLPFVYMDPSRARRLLLAVLTSNLLTIPFVLIKRIGEGGEFLRLNISNLDVNSSGLVYGIAFCALVVHSQAPDQPRARLPLPLLFAASVVLSGSRTALALLVAPFLTARVLRSLRIWHWVAITALLVVVGLAFVARSDPEEFNAKPPAELEGTAVESLSMVGRAWSILVGFDVLSESGPLGTNSVEGTSQEFQDRGYFSFAHSTLLMLIILHGIGGGVWFLLCARRIWSLEAGWVVRGSILGVLIVSGGLITNPKDIALTFLVVLLLFRGRGEWQRFSAVPVALGGAST